MDAAIAVSQLSKDPKRKVGCIIVSADGKKFSHGYNGFASGMKETPDRWKKPQKNEYVIHAELNAVVNCPFDTAGATLYCTYQPCNSCIQLILNSGISKVVFEHPNTKKEKYDVWLEASRCLDDVYRIKPGSDIKHYTVTIEDEELPTH
jgi:deoxycytidylate deaminase